jgi:hypothetical protein
MFNEKEWALAGGLMSYGENFSAMYRRAAYFVDRIFKGTNPAHLPVEQPANQRQRCAQDRRSAIRANLNHQLAPVAVNYFGNLAKAAHGFAARLFNAR